MYAVIRTGGKQYRVSEGEIIEIERLPGESGDAISFDEVLLLGDEATTAIGQPLVAGARVKGQVVAQDRGKKIIVFKIKRRKNYRRKMGHRQEITRVRITGIEAGKAQAAVPPLPPAAVKG